MTKRSPQRASVFASVWMAVFFLVLSVFRMGLDQADDSWYLSDGVTVPLVRFFPLHNWSPLYLAWQHLLSLVWHDPVWRYVGGWGVLALLQMLLPMAFRLKHAWVYTLLLAVFLVPEIRPYIGMFSGVLVLVALCLVLRARPGYVEALAASCVTCSVVGYSRSEFDYGVFVAALATWVAAWVQWRSTRARAKRLGGLALGVALLAGVTVFVMTHAEKQRSGIAFAQHVNVRASLFHLIPADPPPWESDYAERAFGIDLGHNATNGTATIGDFFRANPVLFLKHEVYNLADPKTVAMLLFVVCALGAPWLPRWDGDAAARGLRPVSLFLVPTVLPALLDMVMIFPRDHYVALMLPAVLLFALQSVRRELWPGRQRLLLVAGGMVAMVYAGILLPRLRREMPTAEQLSLHRVECLRKVDRDVPRTYGVAFDSLGIRDVYLVAKRQQVDATVAPRWPEFKAWVAAMHPAWITVNEGLAGRYGMSAAAMGTALEGEFGYVPHDCPNAGVVIYAVTAR